MNRLTRPCPTSGLPSGAVDALLTLADDEFVIGHRHSEWLGLSPFLEEDLTMASIAQDELGHARALYRTVWPDWAGTDAGVARRDPAGWRSCSLVERSSPNWEFALIRHALYDTAEPLRWQHLEATYGDTVAGLHDLVATVGVEERFHERHATDLVTRLGSANPGARQLLQTALDDLWPDTVLLTTGPEGALPWAVSFYNAVARWCDHATLTMPPDRTTADTDRDHRTRRHTDFDQVAESLLAVFAFDPEATW